MSTVTQEFAKAEYGMAETQISNGAVPLTLEQKKLRDDLSAKLDETKKKIRTSRRNSSEDFQQLGAIGAKLHKSLKDAGYPVRHHKYMVKNRGFPPDDPKFYEHIHPVEDLIKFTYNKYANDDPEDLTLDSEFKFELYSRRWGHSDPYTIIRTKTGWTFSHVMGPIPAGKDGRVGGQLNTGIFQLLNHDYINYPNDLPGYFEWLWSRAEDGLRYEQVQDGLNMLADWISLVEKHSPGGVFESYA